MSIRLAISLLFVVVVGVMAHFNALNAPFVFDDNLFVVGNPLLTGFFVGDLWRTFPTRFLVNLTFAANEWLRGSSTSFGYHVVNVAVHVANACLVFFLVRTVLAWQQREEANAPVERDDLLATAAALVFASHPVYVHAVTYIWQRTTLMASFFYLATLLLYALGLVRRSTHRAGSRGLFVLAWATMFMAMICKPISASLPGAVLVLDMWMRGASVERLRHDWQRLVLFLAGLAVTPILLMAFPSPEHSTAASGWHPWMPYVLTQCMVAMTYLRVFFYPYDLHMDRDFALSGGLFEPMTLASVVALSALLALGIYWFRRRKAAGLGILLFFMMLSVEFFVPLGDLIHEHRVYLPSAGLLIALAGVPGAFFRGCAAHFDPWLARYGVSIRAALMLAVAPLVFWTMEYNTLWLTPVAMWENSVKWSPNKARVHVNLGTAYANAGDRLRSLKAYQRAAELEPDNVMYRLVIGEILVSLGRLDEARPHLEFARQREPGRYEVLALQGEILRHEGRYDEALVLLQRALDQCGRCRTVLKRLASCYLAADRLADAGLHMEEGLRSYPLDASFMLLQADLLRRKGSWGEATAVYERYLSRQPGTCEVYIDLGLAGEKAANTVVAVASYRRAVEVFPACHPAWIRLVGLLESTGQGQEAAGLCARAANVSELWNDLDGDGGRQAQELKKLCGSVPR